MSEFGDRLRKLRRDANITQKQIAQYLNITQTAIGKYEKHRNSHKDR